MKEILEATEYGQLIKVKENSGYEYIGLEVETEIGTLGAYPSADPEHPGICLMFKPKGKGDTDYEIDIAYAEVPNGENLINLYSYGDPYTEDWTRHNRIYYEEIKDALDLNENNEL